MVSVWSVHVAFLSDKLYSTLTIDIDVASESRRFTSLKRQRDDNTSIAHDLLRRFSSSAEI